MDNTSEPVTPDIEQNQADASEPVASEVEQNQADAAVQADALIDPKSTELSTEFVGRWSQLISTTNWEKGRIIHEWRETLIGSEAAAATYSDDAWSRRVGGVTPQHVGRLRRVYERFGTSFETYPNLYWSHFLAAIDWDDAELWLEGAAQSRWSISEMRRTRWEANGGDPANQPVESDLASTSEDEDFSPLSEADDPTGKGDGPRSVGEGQEGPRYDEPDFGDEDELAGAKADRDDDQPWDEAAAPDVESPFAKLPSLPVDIAEAVEHFKLAIIRHRAGAWSEVSQEDVLLSLDALKIFVRQ